MDEKKPPDHYYNLGLPTPNQITREAFVRQFGRQPEDFFEQPVKIRSVEVNGERWGSDFVVGPRDGPAVPEPRPFDCPVCELVGFDCGAHG